MKIKINSCSIDLASTFLILFLILVSSTASSAAVQSASSSGTLAYNTIGNITDSKSTTINVSEKYEPITTYAYIPNEWSNNVSVIDLSNDTVISSIPVGYEPYGVAASPDRVYVSNLGGNISVINTATNNVIANIPVFGEGIALFGNKAYVAGGGAGIYVIENNTVTDNLRSTSYPPEYKGVTADGKNVYVDGIYYGSLNGFISVIDPNTNKITSTVPVGDIPCGIATNGKYVYVANQGSDTVSVVDPSENKVISTISVGNQPYGVASDGKSVYVSCQNSDYIYVLNNSEVVSKIPAQTVIYGAPTGISVIGSKLLVTRSTGSANTVTVIDTTTKTISSAVKVGSHPVAFGQFITSLYSSHPVADFAENNTLGLAPLTVQFTDQSTNATSWSWNFGDGNNSTDENPVHTFSTAGDYTVNLTVTNGNGTDSKLATINVLEKTVPVNHWEFSPQEPVCGNTLDINGSAFPEKKVNISVTFEKVVPVSEGKFEYILENVTIPEGLDNLFTVEARGVNNLNVRAKTVLWVTKSSGASGDTAIVSQSNVPAGTYTIKIDGDAGAGVSEVNLKITASQGIQADSNGNFSYFYNTTAVPAGNFEVKIGDITKEITLRPKEIDQPEVVLPVANFSSNISEGFAPLSVQFNNSSENATSLSWDFENDGVIDSNESNPVHVFTVPGNYTVNLTAINANGTDSKSATIIVTEQPAVLPVANFSSNVTTGDIPLSVQFNDLSENVTEWNWSFGDGASSVEQNPTHTYSTAGNYTVTLTANNSEGSNTVTKYSYITVVKTGDAIIEGHAPLSVQFTDLSESATSWKWNFGDGNTSTEQNPAHTYSKLGQYTVTLTANNMAGSTVITKNSYIIVTNSIEAPVADFSVSTTLGKAPLNISFMDKSAGSPNSWKWSFGDGKASTKQNPTHTYEKPGQYTVTLTVNNVAGSSVVTKYNYIIVSNSLKAPVADFSASTIEAESTVNNGGNSGSTINNNIRIG